MNTASNAASALSALVFGYVVGYSGSYNAPFIPMVALLALGATLWWQVDPTRELFPDAVPVHVPLAFESPERPAVTSA
jgi:MFS-type transporter involved in bile tolerance (Atg22 family)